jgi:Skp family chaperone for outer membrane proteins
MDIRSLRVALAVIIITAVALAAPALAADPAPSSAVGFVDVQIVFDSYEKTTKSKNDLDTLYKELDLRLSTLATNTLLSESEAKELADLVVKVNQTDKDKERVKALQDQEMKLDAELKTLQGKKDPTEQEKARLKELQDRSSKAQDAVAKQGEEFKTKLETKQKALTDEIRADILKTVEEVAKAKGLTVVVDKIAVLYGGTDITQVVLDKLNKKK